MNDERMMYYTQMAYDGRMTCDGRMMYDEHMISDEAKFLFFLVQTASEARSIC